MCIIRSQRGRARDRGTSVGGAPTFFGVVILIPLKCCVIVSKASCDHLSHSASSLSVSAGVYVVRLNGSSFTSMLNCSTMASISDWMGALKMG